MHAIISKCQRIIISMLSQWQHTKIRTSPCLRTMWVLRSLPTRANGAICQRHAALTSKFWVRFRMEKDGYRESLWKYHDNFLVVFIKIWLLKIMSCIHGCLLKVLFYWAGWTEQNRKWCAMCTQPCAIYYWQDWLTLSFMQAWLSSCGQ